MRVGAVGYATKQGLGYLMLDFHLHGIVDEVLVFSHPGGAPTQQDWHPGAPVLTGRTFRGQAVDEFLERIDACVFFETPFDWKFPRLCEDHGVKTIMVPMYEWWPERPQAEFDRFLCPSLLDLDIFRGVGRQKAAFLHVPVDPSHAKLRRNAVRFLHNAGGVGSRNHKGTEELLKAIPLVKSQLAQFRITSQSGVLKRLLASNVDVAMDPRVQTHVGDIPREELHAWGDVYVAPEKYNGLSLPLQEAFAAGMPVITTDRYPANTWLPLLPLVAPERVDRVRIAHMYIEIEESVVSPAAIAARIDHFAGGDISGLSELGMAWGREHSWERLAPAWRTAIEETVD